MRQLLFASLKRSFKLYCDLLDSLSTETIQLDIPNLPSNRIYSQLWCVLGARESYLRAIIEDGWKGFSCSLSKEESKDIAKLNSHMMAAGDHIEKILDDPAFVWSESSEKYLLKLLEHEVQHHGQLIRYLYANALEIPKSWKSKYSLD